MAVGDTVTGNFGQILLSVEDLAWADSCLSKEPEALYGSWDSLKEALMETEGAEYPRLVNLPSGEESGGSTKDSGTMDEAGTSTSSDAQLVPENADDFWSKHKLVDVFLPTYKGDSFDIGTSDHEMDSSNPPFPRDSSVEDIFKVWDLEVLTEENDLITQLNNAFDKSYSGLTTPTRGDGFQESKVSFDELLDEIVSGLADLTMSEDPTEVFEK